VQRRLYVSKTQYILKHSNLSAADLVKKAKKDGMKLSDKYIYNIRSKAKGNDGVGVGSGKRGPKPKPKPKQVKSLDLASLERDTVAATVNLDEQEALVLLRLIMSIGTRRISTALQKIEAEAVQL
jgi:hypothetical protein